MKAPSKGNIRLPLNESARPLSLSSEDEGDLRESTLNLQDIGYEEQQTIRAAFEAAYKLADDLLRGLRNPLT
jgi:hypothetical protein